MESAHHFGLDFLKVNSTARRRVAYRVYWSDAVTPQIAVDNCGTDGSDAGAAALVRCASETSIARHGSSIPQAPQEDLVHQHVRRFYTNAAGEQSDHRVWSITGRLLHTLQASLLDLADLINEEPPALHVATQLS